MTETAIIQRESIRGIFLTPKHDVLLMQIHPPQGGPPFWITPGGGLEAGESVAEGAAREFSEELGLEDVALGPLLWRRQHTFDWDGKRYCQSERLYAVHRERFTPHMRDAIESAYTLQFRWWSLDELDTTDDDITPRQLSTIIRDYLRNGPPAEPIPVDIRID